MKKTIKTIKIFALICCGLFASCADWLDIVPEGVATLDNAFTNRVNAERFLFTCYNAIPNQNRPFIYPGNVGGDDLLWNMTLGQHDRSGARIARGDQNSTDPFQNYWDGRRDGRNLWIGIRDCNIFLENIHKVPDMTIGEKLRWISEVKFIKAYLHYFLLQLYGPIPIVDENLPVNATPEEVRVFREPVDKVMDYIVNLIDESVEFLPPAILDLNDEWGRITQPIALAVKAKALVWAASPLLNGNPDYTGFPADKRGVKLFPTSYDKGKWEKALIAIDEAIEMAHELNYTLFEFNPGVVQVTEQENLNLTLRGAVVEKPSSFNYETIWVHPSSGGNDNDTFEFQNFVMPKWAPLTDVSGISEMGATLKMAEQYYSKNGVPIFEDKTWNYAERYLVRRDTGTYHDSYIQAGAITANLNFYREPRFYAHLGFDKGIFEMYSATGLSRTVIANWSGQTNGIIHNNAHQMTGYFVKKLVNFRRTITGSGRDNSPTARFSIPVIRLADLYLLRAEAANEVNSTPNDEVWYWIDLVRTRAGLEGVVDSWANYTNDPGKPFRQEDMRDIIRRERLIELAFEGQRPFDLRRWKWAMQYYNEPMQGWDYKGTSQDEYYRVMTYLNNRNFSTRDYLWPLYQVAIIRNSNLVQNPGW